jgi:hypothetical protein
VVKPGRLTDAEGAGRIRVGTLEHGEVPRADAAATLLAVLDTPTTVGTTFDLLAGPMDIDEALATL